MAEWRRLFFALWPTDRQREYMRETIKSAVSSIEGTASERRNWHVTLVFVGTLDEQRIPDLQNAVADIQCAPFRIRFDRLSYLARPKIACLEATRVPEELLALVSDISGAILALGIPPEERQYRPHITIARKARAFAPERLAQPLELNCSGFELVESVSSPRGVQYHPLKQ